MMVDTHGIKDTRMTKTRVGKTTKRETQGFGIQGRVVVVTVDFPNIIGLRLKGTKTTYYTTAEACWWMAAKAKAAYDKAEKKKAKKARKSVL